MNNGKTWNWRIEKMTPQVELFAGHCRARGCTRMGQVFAVYSYASNSEGGVRDGRKVMCRAHAEATVKKHAAKV